jgi:hypothetical protein
MIFFSMRRRRGGQRAPGIVSSEDVRWALGLVVGLGVAVYVGIITWKQALGLVGYFGAYVLAMGAGIGLIFVVLALTAVSEELFVCFSRRHPALGCALGRITYWAVSALSLVFALLIAAIIAWDMAGFAWASPGAFVVGLLIFLWLPLVGGLIVLLRAIWRRYQPEKSSRVLAAGSKEGEVVDVDVDFEDRSDAPPR